MHWFPEQFEDVSVPAGEPVASPNPHESSHFFSEFERVDTWPNFSPSNNVTPSDLAAWKPPAEPAALPNAAIPSPMPVVNDRNSVPPVVTED
jgi:hypothetical protein